MFKIIVIAALALSGVVAQESAEANAAPEPYSYGYETDSHAASEQRDQSGKVTGFYTLADADGRQRRVEYIADESGFRAKVSTNEVGTKSESPADVEVLASPPTEAQYSVQAPVYKQQVVTQQVQQVQRAPVVVQQPYQQARYTYVQQQQPQAVGYTQYGYYPGYSYGSGYGSGYGVGYGTGYGAAYGGYGVGNYNNHLPSQYYRSVQTTGASVVPSGVRYTSTIAQQPAAVGNYRSYGYQTVPGAVSYTTGAAPVVSRTVSTSSNAAGSSNYIVLKK